MTSTVVTPPSDDDQPTFLEHWRSLPRDGLVPSLATFLDQANPRFAPWLSIVDFESETHLPVRLFGTRLVESLGEITGHNFLDYLLPEFRATVGHAHHLICTQPCGWRTQARATTTVGRDVVVETVSLPLLRQASISSVVKATRVIARLDFREGLVAVNTVRDMEWIDVGAGVPGDLEL